MAELTYGETEICNLSLDFIGAGRITDIDSDESVQGIKCRLHYYHDRNMLQRLHMWRFNASRAQLAQDATWDPDNEDQHFEWEYRYSLPSDFIALRSIYSSAGNKKYNATNRNAIEGLYMYSNESTLQIRYSKLVTDPQEFDPLFVDVLKMKLSLSLLYSLAQSGSQGTRDRINSELDSLMRRVHAMDKAEQALLGRDAQSTWLDARNTRSTGRILEGI